MAVATATLELSERRACKALSQSRSTQRYQGNKPDTDKPLVAAMHELARKHRRYGYRIGDYREHYNHRRPHSSLDYRPPAAFAAACRAAPPLGLATLAPVYTKSAKGLEIHEVSESRC